jgi:hypothetical protein
MTSFVPPRQVLGQHDADLQNQRTSVANRESGFHEYW